MADKSRRVHEAALGWLIIEVSGEHTERLLNLALQSGIELRQIRRLGQHRLRCRLLLRDLYELRPLLTATRCRLRIMRRGGCPFWLWRCRRRLGLIAGSILFALALYVICGFVWRVEVTSIYPLEAAERERIVMLAEEAGLRPGVWGPGVDMAAVSRYIAAEADDLVFAYGERLGVTAQIHIVRRVDAQGRNQPVLPGDIVAAADGLIEQILVRSGTAAVKPGATVKAGDVLVYGYGGGQTVAASALIEARIWSEAVSSWSLREEGLRPSGQRAESLWIRFLVPGERGMALLRGTAEGPYARYIHEEQVYKAFLWRNMPLPVEVILDVWYEQEPYAASYSREQAINHARERAAGLALGDLPGDCDLVKETSIEVDSSADTVTVQVIYEAIADIGRFRPLTNEGRRIYEEQL